MKPRAPGATQTQIGLSATKVIDVVSRFPLLHAYGVGLDIFRSVPEQYRMRAIDYAKWMLAYALDDEIDSCYMFLEALHLDRVAPTAKPFIRGTYLLEMHKHWRKMSGKHTSDVTVGTLAAAALLHGHRVRIVEAIKPDCYITVPVKRLRWYENYLADKYGFTPRPAEEVKCRVKRGR